MKAAAGPSGGARSAGTGTGRIGGIEGAPRSARFSSRSLATFSSGRPTESRSFSYIAPGIQNKNAVSSVFKTARRDMKETALTPQISKKDSMPTAYIAPDVRNKNVIAPIFRDVKMPIPEGRSERMIKNSSFPTAENRMRTVHVTGREKEPTRKLVVRTLPVSETAGHIPKKETQPIMPRRTITSIPRRHTEVLPVKKLAPSSSKRALTLLSNKEIKKSESLSRETRPQKPIQQNPEEIKKLELLVASVRSSTEQARPTSLWSNIALGKPQLELPLQAIQRVTRAPSATELTSLSRGKIVRIDRPLFARNKVAVVTIEKPEALITNKSEVKTKPSTSTEEVVVFQKKPTKNESPARKKDNNNRRYEKDHDANKARIGTITEVWSRILRSSKNASEAPTGREVSDKLPFDPPPPLLSELVKGLHIKGDGSYDEVKETLRRYGKIKKIGDIAKQLVERFTAVKRPKDVADDEVTQEDVARVLRRRFQQLDKAEA